MKLRSGKEIGLGSSIKFRGGKVIESGSGSVRGRHLPMAPLSSFLQPDDIQSSIKEHKKEDTKEAYNPYQHYPVLSPSQVKQEDADN